LRFAGHHGEARGIKSVGAGEIHVVTETFGWFEIRGFSERFGGGNRGNVDVHVTAREKYWGWAQERTRQERRVEWQGYWGGPGPRIIKSKGKDEGMDKGKERVRVESQ